MWQFYTEYKDNTILQSLVAEISGFKSVILSITLIFATLTAMSQTYHEDDKEGLRIFLRQPSAEKGKINAQLLGLQIKDTVDWYKNEKWVKKLEGRFIWNKEKPKQLIEIGWYQKILAGTLDASKWTELEYLWCYNNQLTSLNLTANAKLQRLNCSHNQLSKLDVCAIVELWELSCSYNQLTELDVSTNTKLRQLSCSYNQLSVLNISSNMELGSLSCYNNQLTELDLSANTGLCYLSCSDNQFKTLNLSINTMLRELHCSKNQLTELDLSVNPKLQHLSCSDNQLNTLYINANVKFHWLSCYNNGLLLSDLFANAERVKDNIPIYYRPLGTQTLFTQTISIGKELEFSTPQNVFNGIYTEFSVTQNDNPTPENDYTVTEGKITFNKTGTYTVKMTNKAIISSPNYPAEVIIEITVTE